MSWFDDLFFILLKKQTIRKKRKKEIVPHICPLPWLTPFVVKFDANLKVKKIM